MRHLLLPTASLLLPLALAACGGGGGKISAESARTLTGARAPAEAAADQAVRFVDNVDRADSLILSTVHGATTLANLPTFEIDAACENNECTLRESRSGVALPTLSLDDLSIAPDATVDFGLTKHGITLFRTRTTDIRAYGAWMKHAGFALQTHSLSPTVDGRKVSIRFHYGLVGGDLTGARPTTGSATWRGLMVGTPASGNRAGNLLQGDAALEYDFDAKMLDAAFTDIKDLNRNAAHSTERVQFDDIPVAEKGTFRLGTAGNYIQGGFYGPDHAETAGVFERSGIVGSFGAERR